MKDIKKGPRIQLNNTENYFKLQIHIIHSLLIYRGFQRKSRVSVIAGEWGSNRNTLAETRFTSGNQWKPP